MNFLYDVSCMKKPPQQIRQKYPKDVASLVLQSFNLNLYCILSSQKKIKKSSLLEQLDSASNTLPKAISTPESMFT